MTFPLVEISYVQLMIIPLTTVTSSSLSLYAKALEIKKIKKNKRIYFFDFFVKA